MAVPPPALEQRLAALVPRVRALRVARGASACVLAAVGATAFVLFADALYPLPAAARGLFIAVWVTALGVLVWRLVLRPWHADISLSDVARELGKRLPELGERLSVVVSDEQSETSDAVRAALAEDAARRAKAVDFARAVPAYPAMLRACGAILAVLGFLMASGLIPNSADRWRRVVMPWSRPASANVRVVVTSGEPVVKRGGPVTLTAFAEKIDIHAKAPDTATLVFRDTFGAPEQRLPMTAGGTGAFHVTRPEVPNDFEYRVQIGSAASEWFRVTALDAVELAEETRVEIVSPAYTGRAKATRDFGPLDNVLEHSDITLRLKFTRPASSAHLDWQPNGDAKSFLPALDLSPDRRSATATFRALHSGVLRLALVNEVDGKKLRTVTAIDVRVTPDKPPWFEQVSGVSPRPRTACPGARVRIDFVARDDLSVTGAVLEYILDSFDSKSVTIPVPLTDGGTARAAGHLDFDLAGKGREGGTIRFRVRVTDNRTVGELKLAPQEAFYPATGWSELRLSAGAPPLNEEDIAGQRDAFHEAADGARLAARECAETVASVRVDADGRTALAVDQSARLNNSRERIRRAAAALIDHARDAALTPELRPLATGVREVADRELKTAEDAINKTETDETGRADAFAVAVKQLADAGDKLDALLARNARLARDRLDRAKLGSLAADQAALADAAKAGGEDLLARQQELVVRSRALVAESDPLRIAAEGAKGNEARRRARAASELSALLRDLDGASRRTATGARDALVADIARDQEAVAARAATLFAALDTAARLAGVAPPRPDDFRRVAELAAIGKTVEALTELEKQSQSLDRIAVEFDRWAADRADPKRGAKQLARWQDDLLARLRAATKGADFDALPDDTKTAFRAEQKAVHTALGALALPPDAAVKAARDNAAIHTGTAHGALAADGRGAETAMKLAAESLDRLAEKTPSIGERLSKSLRDFDKLRFEQDSVAGDVEKALRGHDTQPASVAALAKKLAPLVERQKKLGAAVLALDLPGLSERHARVVAALAVAVADLQDGSPFDVQASQWSVRREFERLKLVLEGSAAPDAKADELHRKLTALADALDVHGGGITAKLLEPAAPIIQDAQRQLGGVAAPESPVLLNDARLALQAAESALRDSTKPDEARRRVRTAADALGRLAARLNGTETELERVHRLANNRRLAAARAKELADAKAPFSAPASDEALRHLARELDELAHTRVGAAGQSNKNRVFDTYARLRLKTEPDRLASDQRALAEALDELAAKMADIAELATRASPDPPAPSAADAYLPSRAHAAALRELVRQQRAIHDALTNFSRVLADRLRPAAVNPFFALEAKQRTLAAELPALAPDAAPASKTALAAADHLRTGDAGSARAEAEAATTLLKPLAGGADLATRQQAVLDDLTKLLGQSNAATAQQAAFAVELAGRIAELARAFRLVAKGLDPLDATAQALTASAGQLKDAEKRLLEAARKIAATDTAEAARLRAEADTLLRAASERVSDAAPKAVAGAPVLPGDALRAAELAMRAALDDLTAGTSAEKAMREAATALTTAAKSVGEPK